MEIIRNSLKVNQSEIVSVSLKISKITGSFINLKYTTLMENNPNENQNYITLWHVSEPNIPWNLKPLNTYKIKSTLAEDDISFHDLELTEGKYILGYSLVPEDEKDNTSSFCTSAYMPSLKTPLEEIQYSQISISVVDFGSSFLNIEYNTLKHFNPGKHLNWIGIWDSGADIYQEPPIQTVIINKTSSKDFVTFDNINMISGKSYRVCYFMNGYSERESNLSRKSLACYITFDVE